MVMLIRLIVIIFLLVIYYCRKSEQEQKINCTEEYRGSSGFIESPGYPNGYSENLDCKWRIQSSLGRVIMIKIEDFELQKKYKEKLCDDYLMIIDTITSKVVLHKTCWELDIPTIRSSYCHDIEVIFHSDRGGNERGFRLTWNTTLSEKTKQNNRNCGENVTTVSGEATTKLLNKYITSSSKKFKAYTTSYAEVSSTKSIKGSTTQTNPLQTTSTFTDVRSTTATETTTTIKSTEFSTQSEDSTTLYNTSTYFAEGTTTTKPSEKPISTIIYIVLAGLAFSTIIAVVVVCFKLKNRLKRLLPKNDEEKDDCSIDSNGLWQRPRSFGSDVRKSVDQSKAENIYSEPNDVILSIQRQPKKPLINYDLAKILKETTLPVTAPAKIGQVKVDENETNKKNGGHRHKCQSNIYDEAVPVGNTHKSPGVITKNHVYAEIDDEICKKNVKSKDGKQNYDLAQRNMNVKSKEGKQDYDLAQPVSEEKVLKGKMKDPKVKYDLAKPKPLTNKTVNSSEGNYFILENVNHATSNDYFVLERSGKSVAPISTEESIKLGGNKTSYELAQNIYQDPTVPMPSNNGTKRVSTCPYDVSSNLTGEYDELERVTSKRRNDKNETGGGYDVSEISKIFSLKGLGKKSPYSLAKT